MKSGKTNAHNNAINSDSEKRRAFVAPLFTAGYGERWSAIRLYLPQACWQDFSGITLPIINDMNDMNDFGHKVLFQLHSDNTSSRALFNGERFEYSNPIQGFKNSGGAKCRVLFMFLIRRTTALQPGAQADGFAAA